MYDAKCDISEVWYYSCQYEKWRDIGLLPAVGVVGAQGRCQASGVTGGGEGSAEKKMNGNFFCLLNLNARF